MIENVQFDEVIGPHSIFVDGKGITYDRRGYIEYHENPNDLSEIHRVSGPATIDYGWGNMYPPTLRWMQNDQLHRINGPAILWEKYGAEYYLHNYNYNSKEEYEWVLSHYDKLKFSFDDEYIYMDFIDEKLEIEYTMRYE